MRGPAESVVRRTLHKLTCLRSRPTLPTILCGEFRTFTTTPSRLKIAIAPHEIRNTRTLDPTKLTADHYIDCSLRTQPYLRVLDHSPNGTTVASDANIWTRAYIYAGHSRWDGRKFPPDTRGFLYYHLPPGCPPIAGELRFRLTPSSDPAGFPTGSDLRTQTGIRWSVPLYKIACCLSLRPLRTLLLREGLVSQQTFDLLASAATGTVTGDGSLSRHAIKDSSQSTMQTVSAFGQEFCFSLRKAKPFLLVGTDSVRRRRLIYAAPFMVRVDGKPCQYTPFEGSVVCCFERSKLPEHEGRRVVVIRIKRLVDSDPIRQVPSPDGCEYELENLRPHKGELLMVRAFRKVRPWAVDVDNPRRLGEAPGSYFRVLFENEELYGSAAV
ncbi:hypothetical protein LXA43DRAFT_1028282 [Ganoderma leucocontextum]|nr:hypothetical protein LXA43DRAFT_1028282 [Ganoderma leucocontextum]